MEIYRQKARNEGKPEAALEKIVNGMIEKYYETNCLLEQPYIRANKQTIQELITETVGKLGEKIVVRRFSRFRVGEGA
jgi:elongation factor Ts